LEGVSDKAEPDASGVTETEVEVLPVATRLAEGVDACETAAVAVLDGLPLLVEDNSTRGEGLGKQVGAVKAYTAP
jgi:hypothetical protein